MKHAMKPAKDLIKKWEDKFGELPESEPIIEDNPWFIMTKEEIMTLKMDLIIKSIELGLYSKELEEENEKR